MALWVTFITIYAAFASVQCESTNKGQLVSDLFRLVNSWTFSVCVWFSFSMDWVRTPKNSSTPVQSFHNTSQQHVALHLLWSRICFVYGDLFILFSVLFSALKNKTFMCFGLNQFQSSVKSWVVLNHVSIFFLYTFMTTTNCFVLY